MIEGIFLLLGSNIGDKRRQLNIAQNLINIKIGKTVRKSAFYLTKPWGNKLQDDFYNQVLEIRYNSSGQKLLNQLQDIEFEMGRTRFEKWGPRTIDLDILYFGNKVINEKKLIVPHPEIPNRKFTLVPLVEIAPEFIHPVLLKSNRELLSKCTDTLEIKKV